MSTTRKPRCGSLQFWPRVRAKRQYARIRNWIPSKDTNLLGFAGYKVGMTHVIVTDNRQNSLTKNSDVSFPVTVVECPPIKIASIRFYKNTVDGKKIASEIFSDSADKELARKLIAAKKKSAKKAEGIDYDEIRLLAYTQPRLTGIGKKKPEVFEIAVGGTKEQQLGYAMERLGKEIHVDEVFREGQQLDVHAVTKGKGFQGPVRRFGISLRQHKSEKSVRNPGSLGAWNAQGHIMWRVAHAGKMGYHLRTEYNKLIFKIGKKGEEVNVKGGYLNYGLVKNSYLLIKGGLPGVVKRLIRMSYSRRSNPRAPKEAPVIQYISQESKQGN